MKKTKSDQISKELQKLIDYILANKLNLKYDFAINYDGILYLVDTEASLDKDWYKCCDFGFDCREDNDFFYLFKQVPDDDPIAIMEKYNIMVGRLEDYADSLESD